MLALPHGVAWSGLLTATMAMLGGILPEDRRADGMTLYGLASPAGVVFGPMLGLAIFTHWGFRAIALSLGTIFLLLTCLAFVLPKDREQRERRSALQMPERSMVGPCSVFFATALGYGVLGAYTAQEALKLDLAMPSAFLTFMAVGMVGMRIIMSLYGFSANPVRRLPAMLWMACAGLGILALAPTGLWRHVVSALLYGAGYSMVHTLMNTYVLETVHPERRGAAFGATLFSFDVGIGLGTFAIGGFIGWAVRSVGRPGLPPGLGGLRPHGPGGGAPGLPDAEGDPFGSEVAELKSRHQEHPESILHFRVSLMFPLVSRADAPWPWCGWPGPGTSRSSRRCSHGRAAPGPSGCTRRCPGP